MNTANEQDSNLTNFSSNKFARDYDKEPLVIEDKTSLSTGAGRSRDRAEHFWFGIFR